MTRYRVCIDRNGSRTLYPQGPPPEDPPCGPEGSSGAECFPACSETWLDIIGKRSIDREEQREPVEMLTYTATGPSSFVCMAVERGSAHLVIVDVTGRVVVTAETEPDADLRSRFSIDLRNLRAGVYLCRVVNGNRNVMQTPILATR